MWALALALGALALAAGPVRAEEAPTPPPLTTPFLGEEGEIRLLLRPEFRDAPGLLDDLGPFGIEGLRADLVGPLVAGADPKKPPVPSRLVLSGPPGAVARGREVLRHLDVPAPSVLVALLAVEVRDLERDERGGSLLFDRDAFPMAAKTLFRGVFSQFEPDTYLRSSLAGVTPFPGTSFRFANVGLDVLEDGAFEYVFRLLAEEGEAEYLAWPTVVCTEGSPGTVTSLVELQQRVVSRASGSSITVVPRTDETGVQFRVDPVQVGSDSAVLDLEADLRFALPQPDDGLAATPLSVQRRRVKTRLLVHDQETVLLGGLRLVRRVDEERGLPLLIGVPGLTAEMEGVLETELVVLVRARVLVPGRGAGLELPPGEARRLAALAREEGEEEPAPAEAAPAEGAARVDRLEVLRDAARGGADALLDRLAETWEEPYGLLADGERYAALFARRASGTVWDGPRLSPSSALGPGDIVRFPPGLHRPDLRGLSRQDPFPRDLILEGAGMDRTLLALPGWHPLAERSDVHRLTFRDVTIHCGNAPLRVTPKRFTLRLVRCRVIGFDRGAPGGEMLTGGEGALLASGCRFEVGWGSAPGLADLFRVEGPFLARVGGTLIRGPLLSLYDRDRAAQVFSKCRFVDLPREREVFLTAPHDAVRFAGCAFDLAPEGADAFPATRPLADLNARWR